MKYKALLSIWLFVACGFVFAGVSSRLNITEVDGSPSTYPWQAKFSNGTVTDNGDGTVTITNSGGGSPGGSATQLQYNNSGSFGGVPGTSVTATGPIVSSMTASVLNNNTIYTANIYSTGTMNLGGPAVTTGFGPQVGPYATLYQANDPNQTVSPRISGYSSFGVNSGQDDDPQNYGSYALLGVSTRTITGAMLLSGGVQIGPPYLLYEGFQGNISNTRDVLWTLPSADSSGFWKSDGSENLSISGISASDLTPAVTSTSTWVFNQVQVTSNTIFGSGNTFYQDGSIVTSLVGPAPLSVSATGKVQTVSGSSTTFYTAAGNYTYTVPSWAHRIRIFACGAGGGGGGADGAPAGISRGGAPGGGGGYCGVYDFDATELPASTNVVVGAGGTGGIGVAGSSGTYAVNGGTTTFGTFISAHGGGGGQRGYQNNIVTYSGQGAGQISAGINPTAQNLGGTGGQPAIAGQFFGLSGGGAASCTSTNGNPASLGGGASGGCAPANNVAGGNGGLAIYGGAGGGGGGGVTSGNSASGGGSGGANKGYSIVFSTYAAGGNGGTSSCTGGSSGPNGTSSYGGYGGGGGGADTATTGCNGGNGGYCGGGGGGGGAGTSTGGNGGNGGDGCVILTAY